MIEEIKERRAKMVPVRDDLWQKWESVMAQFREMPRASLGAYTTAPADIDYLIAEVERLEKELGEENRNAIRLELELAKELLR